SSSKALFDELLEKLFEKSGKEVVIAINVDKGKASIRSKTKDISKLAALLGGGGHPHAAGFPIKNAYDLKTEKGRQSFLKLLAKKAKMLN
ncbi:MAG: DHHA1 domain-containing protein, partial [Candidatus Micrarchaeia archaeon]